MSQSCLSQKKCEKKVDDKMTNALQYEFLTSACLIF